MADLSKASNIVQEKYILYKAKAGLVPNPSMQHEEGKECLEEAMPWPVDRLACGILELRGGSRPDWRSKSALCTIEDGILSFQSDPRTGEDDIWLAEMNVKEIVVTVFRDAPRQFVISSCLDPAFHERTLFRHTRIDCMASSQEARNKWLAVLHRTGVHLHGEMEDGSIKRVRQGVPQAVQ